ncbi:carbohydrate binding domain-containing protein [Fibrobacter succinogenes]|uniref:carbohydrate binding domain-containing protein n=1 Tax=Fibrobacter succinogenes TaxID=833 RepID=UPI0015678C33|nr:carbohydrate binding domain-containing protein [Fibrobacter succinogenes]
MRFYGFLACPVLAASLLIGCSSDGGSESLAGIEIGNPAFALTADFSVDYTEVVPGSLRKPANEEKEPVLLDSFTMTLTDVITYSSYYSVVPPDVKENGNRVWPGEDVLEGLLPISFTEGTSVDEPFKSINLDDGGYLKEIGVMFKPEGPNAVIRGRVLLEGEYVPFEYDLNGFQQVGMRYHLSQIDVSSDSVANLSVIFHVRCFVKGVDFSKAEIDEDGVIRLDNTSNVAIWQALNKNFVPSFRPLRYSYKDAQGNEDEDFVKDIWDGVVGAMSDNTIVNGDFSNGLNNWIFFTQMRGEATANVVGSKSGGYTLEVDVTNGGNKSYSVQLLQEDVALVAGKKYKCVFTIWSNVEGRITARIGTYDDYETVGFQEHPLVKTSGQSFEKEFSPLESTPFARFELNLGGSVRKFYIKDIKIYRLEE